MFMPRPSEIAPKPVISGLMASLSLQSPYAGQLLPGGMPKLLAPGETLVSEGDPAHSVYEVMSGMLRICKLLPDGRRQIIGFLVKGRCVGISSQGTYGYTTEAITAVTLRQHRRPALERMLQEQPDLMRRLLGAAMQELQMLHEQVVLLGRKAAAEKVASFLLGIADQQGEAGPTPRINLPMGRHDIADYLGLTVETVSRTLSQLKRKRTIAVPTASRIEIRDREALEELATGALEPAS
jgi:CRP/FNR family transcriptional regulator, anaerobic regulatory protein